MFVVSLVLVALGWELYKLVGPADGGDIVGMSLLPRANDKAMPHVWDMVGRLDDPAVRGNPDSVLRVVLTGAWYSFRLALVGLVLGVVFGLLLAMVMSRSRLAQRAVLPYLVLSQTVPLIALAPLVVAWGGKLEIFGWSWPRWLSASVLGAFLAFFPVSVGALRGLTSPTQDSLDLMHSLAATGGQTMRRLRFPAAVPYLVPALKLAASAAVVGVVVAEISTGLPGGIGRIIVQYSQQYSGDPPKLYTAIFGAAALGLAMAGLVAALDAYLTRNRPEAQ